MQQVLDIVRVQIGQIHRFPPQRFFCSLAKLLYVVRCSPGSSVFIRPAFHGNSQSVISRSVVAIANRLFRIIDQGGQGHPDIQVLPSRVTRWVSKERMISPFDNR